MSVSLVGQVKHVHGPAHSTVMGKSVAKHVSVKMVRFVTPLMADVFVHQVRLLLLLFSCLSSVRIVHLFYDLL